VADNRVRQQTGPRCARARPAHLLSQSRAALGRAACGRRPEECGARPSRFLADHICQQRQSSLGGGVQSIRRVRSPHQTRGLLAGLLAWVAPCLPKRGRGRRVADGTHANPLQSLRQGLVVEIKMGRGRCCHYRAPDPHMSHQAHGLGDPPPSCATARAADPGFATAVSSLNPQNACCNDSAAYLYKHRRPAPTCVVLNWAERPCLRLRPTVCADERCLGTLLTARFNPCGRWLMRGQGTSVVPDVAW
jgi:hypothetical protein